MTPLQLENATLQSTSASVHSEMDLLQSENSKLEALLVQQRVLMQRVCAHLSPSPPSFSAEVIISVNADGSWSVYATDLDGDGDMDVLSGASANDNKIAWYRNNGNGTFTTMPPISINADGARSVERGERQ